MFDKKPICHIFWQLLYRLRPHHEENTGSRLITEVKPSRAMLVLGWVTTQEYLVLQTFFPFRTFCQLPTFFFFFCRNNIVLCHFSHFSFYHANENISMTLELLLNPLRRSSNSETCHCLFIFRIFTPTNFDSLSKECYVIVVFKCARAFHIQSSTEPLHSFAS